MFGDWEKNLPTTSPNSSFRDDDKNQGERKSNYHDTIARKTRGSGGNETFGHAIATTLRGRKGLIEYYELYRFPRQPVYAPRPIAVAVVQVGNQLDGPVGTVHGGIIALLFDDVMSFSCVPLLFPAATKDLAVQYKRPQPHDQYVQIRVYRDETATTDYNDSVKGRKAALKKRLFLKATCSSLGTSTVETAPFGPDEGVLYSTATITVVQVAANPPSARGDEQRAHSSNSNNPQPPALTSRL